ncbi:enoyl-CoA hydratase/carnithine racemase [Halomonas campaniensis]|uniref:Enoyl-CoA hydratase/carnithine racemase n=1 Tax=Halomonas campaniensis TaxID=213554 RepID=A0A7W5PC93_9GAMM|nr:MULTISPECIES: crotonase/enoyl-CoA hydratase family protein [Halomonas]MBB3332618.1 enoyl-CoA hydratase/carnithine racemase [Halomonas campaniensis]
MAATERFHERVTLEIDHPVAEVRLARPRAHNGLDWAMIDGLLAAQRRLAELDGLRAVVLAGEGDSFCAGLDMGAIMDQPARLPSLLEPDEAGINPVQRLALGWREAGVPVIAALHGHVYGGGLQIALGADIRVVHPEARLALLEIVWGIIPDMGISVTAGDIRGDVLRELAWTGRKVAGEEAVTLGLATRLADDPQRTARDIATAVAARSPRAVAAAGELFTLAPGMTPRERLALEARLQRGLLGGEEQREAVAARLAGRPPRFP